MVRYPAARATVSAAASAPSPQRVLAGGTSYRWVGFIDGGHEPAAGLAAVGDAEDQDLIGGIIDLVLFPGGCGAGGPMGAKSTGRNRIPGREF
jgi:hypothetical protein